MEFLKQPRGAYEADIRAAEAAYCFESPEELRRFWLESDGPILWFGHKELQFFSIAEILEDIYSVKQRMPGAVPLCMDGNSNVCVARVEGAKVSGYYVVDCSNLGWDDAGFIAETFSAFLTDSEAPERRLHT